MRPAFFVARSNWLPSAPSDAAPLPVQTKRTESISKAVAYLQKSDNPRKVRRRQVPRVQLSARLLSPPRKQNNCLSHPSSAGRGRPPPHRCVTESHRPSKALLYVS